MKRLLTFGTALSLSLVGVPLATAQGQDAPSVAVSAGAGMAFPLHGDFDFTAPEWQLAIRAAAAQHFVLEGFFDEWRHASEEVRLGVPLLGPTGPIGQIGRLEQRTEWSARTVGFNLLGRGSTERVSVTGGGGIGYMTLRRVSTDTVSDCVASVPGVCQNRESEFSNSSFSFQTVAGVDVFITSRVAAYAQFQSITPSEDAGSTHLSVIGGMRFRIW